jgi:hypothetical protein
MRETVLKEQDAATLLFGRNGAMMRKINDGAATGYVPFRSVKSPMT